MFHREGQKIVLLAFFLVSAAVLISQFYIEIPWLRVGLQVFSLLILVLILQFFRNPKRVVQKNFDEILSPVDGKVVVIELVVALNILSIIPANIWWLGIQNQVLKTSGPPL